MKDGRLSCLLGSRYSSSLTRKPVTHQRKTNQKNKKKNKMDDTSRNGTRWTIKNDREEDIKDGPIQCTLVARNGAAVPGYGKRQKSTLGCG